MLILVPINAKEPLPVPNNVPYRHNVKILDPVSFAKFFGYKGELYIEFMDNVELAKLSTYIEAKIPFLNRLAKKSKSIIKKSFYYSQNELENYLNAKNQMNLLEYSSDHLDNWV